MLRAGHTEPIHFGHDVNPDAALHTCETLLVVYSGARVELARVAAGAARRTGVVGSMVEAGRTMSASTDPMQSPEWEAARHDWYEQARTQLDTLQQAVNGATPGSLALETIYAPMHDMAGLAGVFGYDMLGRISRSLIETLRKGCTTRVLGLLATLAESDKEKYATFWKAFGAVLKEGGADFSNKDKVAKLLRFASTHADTPEESVSLAEYVARLKPGQEKIYFVTAETFNAAKNSPHLEVFRKKGIEVLLLSDRVDEWVVAQITEFEGKALTSVAKGALELGTLADEAEKQQQEQEASEFKDLTDKIQKSLGERVKQVRVTHRLTESPACLVSDEHDVSGNLARILKAVGQKAPDVKPILEVNPKHPVVQRLKSEETKFDDWSAVLFEQALLAEGGQLDDPATFVKRVNELMLSMAAR